MTDTGYPTSATDLLVTMVGPDGARRPVRVRSDAPVSSMARTFASMVGTPSVNTVMLGDGTLLDLNESLAAAGVRQGATLHVNTRPPEPAAPPVASVAPQPETPPRPAPTVPRARVRPSTPRAGRDMLPAPVGAAPPLLWAAAAAVLIVGVVIGLAVAPSGSHRPTTTQVTPPAAAAQAFGTWLAGRGDGRQGPQLKVDSQLLRVASSGPSTVVEAVIGTDGLSSFGPFALTVALDHGHVTGPVTLSGLPVGTGVLPESGRPAKATGPLGKVVDDWVTANTPTSPPGVAASSTHRTTRIVSVWVPSDHRYSGVIRVEVTLTSPTEKITGRYDLALGDTGRTVIASGPAGYSIGGTT